MKIGVVIAALLAALPLNASQSPQQPMSRLVSASQGEEAPVMIALVDPHTPTSLPSEARSLAADVNAERATRGLSPLVRDDTLDRFAYAKAVEMAARGYFGHTNPNGVTFQDRLRAWHLPTTYAAENIAFDYDEPRAHAAFMHSPPHAQNVLDSNERKLGVAVVTVGDRETFYVEDFSAK